MTEGRDQDMGRVAHEAWRESIDGVPGSYEAFAAGYEAGARVEREQSHVAAKAALAEMRSLARELCAELLENHFGVAQSLAVQLWDRLESSASEGGEDRIEDVIYWRDRAKEMEHLVGIERLSEYEKAKLRSYEQRQRVERERWREAVTALTQAALEWASPNDTEPGRCDCGCHGVFDQDNHAMIGDDRYMLRFTGTKCVVPFLVGKLESLRALALATESAGLVREDEISTAAALRKAAEYIVNRHVARGYDCRPPADRGDGTCGARQPVEWCEENCMRRLLARAIGA